MVCRTVRTGHLRCTPRWARCWTGSRRRWGAASSTWRGAASRSPGTETRRRGRRKSGTGLRENKLGNKYVSLWPLQPSTLFLRNLNRKYNLNWRVVIWSSIHAFKCYWESFLDIKHFPVIFCLERCCRRKRFLIYDFFAGNTKIFYKIVVFELNIQFTVVLFPSL